VSLISDKFTPWTNEGIVHPPSLEYDRRMKYMMNTKELARPTFRYDQLETGGYIIHVTNPGGLAGA
jgi:hypothetical protein